jgi:hypothetical protein
MSLIFPTCCTGLVLATPARSKPGDGEMGRIQQHKISTRRISQWAGNLIIIYRLGTLMSQMAPWP